MPFESGLVSGVVFLGWFLWLWQTGRVRTLWRQTTVDILRPHYIQLILQTTLFVYWSFYWDEVGRRAPFIAAQIVFAYLFEMLLTWTRGKAWRFRLAPFPIVYSINLFLWFKDQYFAWQLVMLAGAYLAKEFITWERNGRRSHLLNPSGAALAGTGVLLMATDSISLTYGLDLTWSFSVPPHFYEVIFLLGLVVQVLFSTTWITCGAAATLWLLYSIAERVLGTPLAPQPFDAAVFLGLTLLVTDPATSPRLPASKCVFGVLYGATIFLAYIGLRLLHQPAYFDKILVIPLVNLLVPWCEAVGERFSVAVRGLLRRDFSLGRAGALTVYAVFFLSIIGKLDALDEGFETPLPPHAVALSPKMSDLKIRLDAYRLVAPQETFAPFAFAAEWRNYRPLWTYAPQTAEEYVAFGRSLLEVGRSDEALSHLQTAVRIDPESADAQLYLGNAYLRTRQLPAAVFHLERAMSLRPNDQKTLANLGTAFAMQGHAEEAIVALREATELNPEDATALANLGTALLQVGRSDEAFQCLNRAVAVRPANVSARLQLGIALFAAGRVDEARQQLRRVVFLNPENTDAQRLLASIASENPSASLAD